MNSPPDFFVESGSGHRKKRLPGYSWLTEVGLMVWGLGLTVQGLGFRVLRVQDSEALGCGANPKP